MRTLLTHLCALMAGIALIGGIGMAGWSISSPANGSTYHHDDDVDATGMADTHPSNRNVKFGYIPSGTTIPTYEQTVLTSSQQIMPNLFVWTCTLLPPSGGWQLSPLDEAHQPVGDHVLDVLHPTTGVRDARTNGHIVVQ